MLALTLLNGWYTQQLDFVLAYPQAKMKTQVYMQIPAHFKVKNNALCQNKLAPRLHNHVLLLLQNLYGLKDTGLTWHKHLKQGLIRFGFTQSKVNPCLFYKKDLYILIYVDNCIVFGKHKEAIDNLVQELKKDFNVTDKGDISMYLGLQIDKKKTESGQEFHLSQLALIKCIIKTVNLKDERQHKMPAQNILTKDGLLRKTSFHYQSMIGQLNYLAATTWPNILMAVHQCTRLCNNPRLQHKQAIKQIVQYLKGTANKGLILCPNPTVGLECFANANFAGSFKKNVSANLSSCLSRTDFFVSFAKCLIIWNLKLQPTIALSTTEAEYIALSTTLCNVSFVMHLLDKFKWHGVHLPSTKPNVCCKVFKDNIGALELAKVHKLRPRTKHIAIQYHHFCRFVVEGCIDIEYVLTKEQVANLATKPLACPQLKYLCDKLMDWDHNLQGSVMDQTSL